MNDNSSIVTLKHIIVGLIFLLGNHANAEQPHERDEYFTHHRASITGALTSSDCYQLQLSYHYMINRYIGFGGSFGNWQNYYETGWAAGSDWNIASDDNKPWNLYLRPSVVLKSPAVRIKNVGLSLYAEPGIMFNVPYTKVCIENTHNMTHTEYSYISTNKGQWLALDVHLGVNVDVGPCGFSLGYLMSNLDIYSHFRHLSYRGVSFKDFYPKKSFMQGAYLTMSYNF